MQEYSEDWFSNEDEIDRLHSFENRLIEAVEIDEFSILCMVLTGNREREFIFLPQLHKSLFPAYQHAARKQQYPIQIHNNDDLNRSIIIMKLMLYKTHNVLAMNVAIEFVANPGINDK